MLPFDVAVVKERGEAPNVNLGAPLGKHRQSGDAGSFSSTAEEGREEKKKEGRRERERKKKRKRKKNLPPFFFKQVSLCYLFLCIVWW